ncbi:MAG TPA: XRE family transcriptional regulator [Lutibacter sp.]|nr:XRE family transcriptional regulator [Lutibacter sp.]
MTSLMKVTFGEYIRELRNLNGLTLTQLAAKLDLDSANLSKIENGKRDFDEKRLLKLAKVFKLNIKELKKEFVSDQIAKQIYECDCTKEMLVVAEEKAEYRRQLNNQYKKAKAI